jgi:ATP-dependent DNA helicase PIF1
MDNNSCNQYNSKKLIEINKPIVQINAINSSTKAKNAKDDQFSGLASAIHLCEGARVNLTNNIWTEVGLVNGAGGYVRDIIFEENSKIQYL